MSRVTGTYRIGTTLAALVLLGAAAAVSGEGDAMVLFDFSREEDVARFRPIHDAARQVHPEIAIFDISSRTGEGMDRFYDWLREEVHREFTHKP